jgi:DNA (cytosine-5)-methyltransferase 1
MTYINKYTGVAYVPVARPTGDLGVHNKVISLFSGAGGLDIGLEQAGYETAVCVENDAHCRETLRRNRPGWKLIESTTDPVTGEKREAGDIRKVSAAEVLEVAGLRVGEAALVVGGAPCQPFSNMGKKEGSGDEKNGDLFLEFVRIVSGVHPRAFLFENVRGIAQSKHTEVIEYMRNSFRGLGYTISFSVLNAADYGVPQKRERFIMIGVRNSSSAPFPVPTHFKSARAWEGFCEGFDDKPNQRPKPWMTVNQAFSKLTIKHTERHDYAVMNISEEVQARMKFIAQGQNFHVLPMHMRPQCWKNGKHQGQDTFGRMRSNEPSVTIRTAAYNPSKGCYIHPTLNRGLSTLEMASLQGFPSSWRFYTKGRDRITLVSGGKQIGNAVPPPLAKALGLSLATVLRPTPPRVSRQRQARLAQVN